MMLELVDGFITTSCKVCRQPIKLEVTQNAPLWEMIDADVMYSPFKCPLRLRLRDVAKYGPGIGHLPMFSERENSHVEQAPRQVAS